jgi:hypothetical protein
MTPRLVMTFDGKTTKLAPEFCEHQMAYLITDDPNPLDECYKCPDCGAWLDEHFEVVRTPTDEIPY